MNTEEKPLTALQTNPEDGTVLCSQVDTKKTSLQMASDVNENKLNGDNEQSVTGNEDIGLEDKDVQDSINNNESCNVMCGQLSCKKGCEEYDRTVMDSLASAPLSTKENATTKGKRVSGRRGNRYKKSSNGKSTGFSSAANTTLPEDNGLVESVHELATLELSVSNEARNQKQLRNSLFSLIREGFEQTDDARMLPTCLHQIAETYFLEEDYEKAMQFIQLERIYHEQLLANLSAIQEQWERKWKTTNLVSSTLFQNSDKGLSSQEFKRLSTMCSSHQDPQAVQWKLQTSDKLLQIQSLPQLLATAEPCDVDCSFTDCPDRESEAGSKTTSDRKPGVAVMNLPPDVSTSSLTTRRADDQALHSQSHAEEQHLSISGATLETPSQPTGTEGRANPDSSVSSGDAGKNNNLLQPEATANSSPVSEIETFSKEGVEEQAGSPMVDKLIPAATAPSDCVSAKQGDGAGGSTSVECTGGTRDGITLQNWIIHADSRTGELGQPGESGADQICSGESPSRAQHQAAVEFIASLLNGDLKDSESFLSHLEFQEETYSEEEMSPSPGESVLGEGFLSLDELAKRIEIEEVSPVAGLVSILKKRNGSEGDKTFQSSQKQAKRKVRFQETDDALEQEEISGGSCILLIALCIVTVFLSIGGTALYCTFGDMDSSVCKDFTANVDFYYTQAVQGIEELRHWLFVT